MNKLDSGSLQSSQKISPSQWFRSGEPVVWITAAAVSLSIMVVVGLLGLLAIRGFAHFWPSDVIAAKSLANQQMVLGEIVDRKMVPLQQLKDSGLDIDSDEDFVERLLIKQGNRDITGIDFAWYLPQKFQDSHFPDTAMVVERREWGNLYGYLQEVKREGEVIADARENDEQAWLVFEQAIARTEALVEQIEKIEKDDIGRINYSMEQLRLGQRRLELEGQWDDLKAAQFDERSGVLELNYLGLQGQLGALYSAIQRDSYTVRLGSGRVVDMPISKIVFAYRPNGMGVIEKLNIYRSKLAEFLLDDPREANTEGGVYPAIFGTVMMVLLMSIIVAPFGVIAAVYLREYARQGWLTQVIRIAVNNLAGVPSIVYGVFGLGFFVYFLGAEIDQLAFPEALPSPTFGTPGLLWASLTLALLTLPVVIVATEEGLARIPRSVKEGSLALGATRAETLWRVVLPMASPAMMTGLILAVARAAGEVAPLMLVGVVKLAPTLPLDGNYPYMHLDQKFMHLGFHIYDVGFQSPNVEAARPLVYATALLLVLIIALLNTAAVSLRNRLRERYKALDV
jgi:phosphate transport system permease protein